MTEFDKQLVEKAKQFSRWRWRDINILVDLADTDEGRIALCEVKRDLYDSVCETL